MSDRAGLPPTLATLLEQAKEERTFGFSELMEVKERAERKISKKLLVQGPSANEEVNACLERLEYFNRGDPEALLRGVRGDNPACGDTLLNAGHRSAGPSHANVPLDPAARELYREGLGQLADRTGKAQRTAEQGVAVRTGLNIPGEADEQACGGDQQVAGELRNFCRAMVSSASALGRLYKGFFKNLSAEGFAQRIAFLTRTLGEDIRLAGPSVEPAQLHCILGGLKALRVLDSVHERCGEMIMRIRRQSQLDMTPAAVMQQLLPFVGDVVPGPSNVNPIPERLGISPDRLDVQIAVLRESRNLLSMIPPGVYRDLETRTAGLRAMQQAMDILIEKEESA
ncbi:TyeA family type III secretion system gatekeeper subunit [Sinorhizobium sp. 7-81]|uniref:TyeA family type III secretion system gatekeeper subunit n=1 Tax=Sinorhizobium sp. 8-89 TaxID=3049089 RepID=UPI0024C33D0D|nr:TyeA family type III secretion system gatekeeper subunit [Sinorhizobium sp. 8-89]MDK1492989.1 TyeA family type III secretion system gatekeeper subunit [Sinorhizobium sp. 8-89]